MFRGPISGTNEDLGCVRTNDWKALLYEQGCVIHLDFMSILRSVCTDGHSFPHQRVKNSDKKFEMAQ